MDKIEVSDSLFRAARSVMRLPETLREIRERAVQSVCDYAACALDRVGALVRGCGCTSEDAECCRRATETNPLYRDWCLCRCHDREITTRTLGQEVN